mgnify:FL=1
MCIRDRFQEELQYIDSSIIFAVRNMMGKIIGSIRVFKWDRKKTLPVQKIFGVNPLSSIHTEVDYNYWHIGRFAIDSFSGIPTITLFKQLMIYAIHPIVCDDKSYMIAETDSKLLTVMNALGIQTVQLGDSVNYLASETVPIYSSKIGLLPFYNHFRKLYQASWYTLLCIFTTWICRIHFCAKDFPTKRTKFTIVTKKG